MLTYRPLSAAEHDRLLAGAELARRLVHGEGAPNFEQLQSLYDGFLDDLERPEDAVRALGVAFGDLMTVEGWLDWGMMIDADFGDDFALIVQDRQLGCSPLSMIANRLEDGEPWDLRDLAASTVSQLRRLGQEAASNTTA